MDEKYFHKTIVSCIIFNSKKQIILAKRSMKEDVLPGFWGIPSGKVELLKPGKDILEKEVQREIMEEIEITVKNLKYLRSFAVTKEKINVVFTAEIEKGTPKPLEDTDEVKWISLKDIKKLDKVTPNLIETIELALK